MPLYSYVMDLEEALAMADLNSAFQKHGGSRLGKNEIMEVSNWSGQLCGRRIWATLLLSTGPSSSSWD